MIVADASILVEFVLQSPIGITLGGRVQKRGESLHVPHLADLEVAQTIRRLAIAGQITAERGLQAIRDYSDIRLSKYPHQPLLPRVWELRHNHTAYDAAYIALAEMLNAPLITRDAAFAASTIHHARIELV